MATTGATALTFGETGGLDAFTYGDITANTGIVFGETGVMDAFRFGNLIANEAIIFGGFAKPDDKSVFLPQPVLPVLKPTFKSVDGKTLADGFNRGLVRDICGNQNFRNPRPHPKMPPIFPKAWSDFKLQREGRPLT